MSVQTIDADAKPERRGKAVLGAATKVQGGIVNVAGTQPATPVWKGYGEPCPAGQYMSIRTQRVAIPERKRRTEHIAEHTHALSTVEDVRCKSVAKIQFSSHAPAAISGNANVHSGQGDVTRRRHREVSNGISGAEVETRKVCRGDRCLLYWTKVEKRGSLHRYGNLYRCRTRSCRRV